MNMANQPNQQPRITVTALEDAIHQSLIATNRSEGLQKEVDELHALAGRTSDPYIQTYLSARASGIKRELQEGPLVAHALAQQTMLGATADTYGTLLKAVLGETPKLPKLYLNKTLAELRQMAQGQHPDPLAAKLVQIYEGFGTDLAKFARQQQTMGRYKAIVTELNQALASAPAGGAG